MDSENGFKKRRDEKLEDIMRYCTEYINYKYRYNNDIVILKRPAFGTPKYCIEWVAQYKLMQNIAETVEALKEAQKN